MTPTGIVIIAVLAFLVVASLAYFIAKRGRKENPLGFAFLSGLIGIFLALFAIKIHSDTKNNSGQSNRGEGK